MKDERTVSKNSDMPSELVVRDARGLKGSPPVQQPEVLQSRSRAATLEGLTSGISPYRSIFPADSTSHHLCSHGGDVLGTIHRSRRGTAQKERGMWKLIRSDDGCGERETR